MERIENIHFVGIGGIGMSGIAEVMINQGYRVSGSDLGSNSNTDRLASMGGKIYSGHERSNLGNVDVVVTSSAIADDNPEILEAKARDIPVIPRAEMLSELMRRKYGIAISGTHGKTTTTSMIASMLDAAGFSPTYVIGGRLLSNDRNASLGSGEYFVAEADESDGSFLLFHPVIAVVTNIDNDHLGAYQDDMQQLLESFRLFATDIPFYGAAVLCSDDAGVVSIMPDVHRRIITYGFEGEPTVKGSDINHTRHGTTIRISSEKYDIDRSLKLGLYGSHNALNALASICVGLELDIDHDSMFAALEAFQGISRRFNSWQLRLNDGRVVTVIDDYGHHPTEINNVVETIRSVFPDRRLVFIFEPHRYSRINALFDAFVESLVKADYLVVLPVYAASENEIPGATAAAISNAARSIGMKDAHTVSGHETALDILDSVVEDNDVVLFMGAGSIGSLAADYLKSGEVVRNE